MKRKSALGYLLTREKYQKMYTAKELLEMLKLPYTNDKGTPLYRTLFFFSYGEGGEGGGSLWIRST